MMFPFFTQISFALALLLLAAGSVSAGEQAVDAAAASMSPNMLMLLAVAAGLTMYRVVRPRSSGFDNSDDDETLRPA